MNYLKSILSLWGIAILSIACQEDSQTNNNANSFLKPSLELIESPIPEATKNLPSETERTAEKIVSIQDLNRPTRVAAYRKKKEHAKWVNIVSQVLKNASEFDLWEDKDGILLLKISWQIIMIDAKNEAQAKLLWKHELDYKDGRVVNLRLVDMDADGNDDVIVCYGDESNFFTKVFVHDSQENTFEVVDFEANNSFATLLDIDGDQKVELLIKKYPSDESKINLEVYEKELQVVYEKLAGQFDAINSARLSNPIALLLMGFEIKILQFDNKKLVDCTHKFSDHLRWRASFLQKIKKDLKDKEKEVAEELIKGLKQ